MKNNRIWQGFKAEKKHKDGFYYFIVDHQIDWVILISILAMLPYLGSHDYIFVVLKSSLFVCSLALTLSYLKLWNKLRKLENLVNNFNKINNKNINANRIVDFRNVIERFEAIIPIVKNEYLAKHQLYPSFQEFLKSDKTVLELLYKEFNTNIEATTTAISLVIGVIVNLQVLRTMPQLRDRNFTKLVIIVVLIFIFFILYAIESSIIK